jgi:hypothetical protein
MIASNVRRLAAVVVLAVSLALPTAVQAQEPEPADPASSSSHAAADIVTFLAGAAAAFAIHEGGHLAFDTIFDARPRLQSVHFGPVPFFAITPSRPLSPRKLFVVASAGLWTQEISSEWLLPKHRDLRHEHAPFAKGMLVFDVLTSIGYGAVALAEAGPVQRDTRGIAEGAGVSERAIGAMVIAPAVLEAYRYFRPDSQWAKWAMRAVEAGSVILIVKP